jgi:hypothetical protein
MNSILLGVAVGLLLGVIIAAFGERSWGKFLAGGIVGPCAGAFVGFICAIVIGAFVPMKDTVYGPGTLVSMRSSDGLSGTFIWGSGSVNSTVTYNFMQRMDDGSLSPRSVYANDLVRLIEDPELKDVGYWRTTIRECDPNSALYNWGIFLKERERYVRQEFRVPVGTVVQQFKVR